MDSMKFTGFVEHIFDADEYKQKFVVANYIGDDGRNKMAEAFKNKESKEYPVALMFSASVKSGANEQLMGIAVGDEVEVTYLISGKSGISKKNNSYYCIVDLNVLKSGGIRILAKNPKAALGMDEPMGDMPF